MAKVKKSFFCQNCGTQYANWQGQCNSCREWNTIAEEIIQKEEKVAWKTKPSSNKRRSRPMRINEISALEQSRFDTKNEELNRVLGGGLVPGSLTLLGGEPGIGKSTLMLQIALQLPYKVLYVSGEESAQQIKMRAERINPNADQCYILTETKTQHIFQQIEAIEPQVVIIDSIQTLHTDYIESGAGSISQIRETTTELIQF
ncbi:MAG TPA: AAA family ATPase, partial [Flavobacteriaceae bacterium]|nr:AAA family ATPase [Flavobacteriaceae bacterium]